MQATWGKKAALLLLSTLLSFVSLEVFTRAYRFGPSAVLPWVMQSIRQVGESGMIRATPELDIGWQYLPNLDTRQKKARFRTNSHGLRDREYSLAKPPGTYRVVVVGDSVTVPEGVEIEDAYHSLVEERLTSELGRRFELVNFAVAGHALPQYFAMIRHRALAWQPDLVVVGFCINDFFWDEEYAARHADKPYEVQPKSHPFFHLYLLDWIAEARANRGRPPAKATPDDPPAEWQLPEVYRTWLVKEIARFGRLSAETGVPILFAFVMQQSRGYTSLSNTVRRAALENRMYFVDLSESFPPSMDADRYIIYRVDGHPNAAANRKFADTLYEYLVSGAIPGFPVHGKS